MKKIRKFLKELLQKLWHSGFDGIFLVATNPVDILTYAVWKFSGFQKNESLVQARFWILHVFAYLLGDYFDVDTRNVHAYIIGEHGDTELPVWSQADIAGTIDFRMDKK